MLSSPPEEVKADSLLPSTSDIRAHPKPIRLSTAHGSAGSALAPTFISPPGASCVSPPAVGSGNKAGSTITQTSNRFFASHRRGSRFIDGGLCLTRRSATTPLAAACSQKPRSSVAPTVKPSRARPKLPVSADTRAARAKLWRVELFGARHVAIIVFIFGNCCRT